MAQKNEQTPAYSAEMQAKIRQMETELKKFTDAQATANKNYMKQIGLG